MKKRIQVRKFGGDDLLSWAVFVDGLPVVTGLSRTEASYHRGIIEKLLIERAEKGGLA